MKKMFIGFLSGVLALFRPRTSSPDANAQASPERKEVPQEEVFPVVGTHYYLKNIGRLATANPDWKKTGKALAKQGYAGRRLYRYRYINKPLKLVMENSNPHDHNAVMVQVAGEKVGYISAEQALHVRYILNHRPIQFISAFVGGGDYKEIYEDGTFQRVSDEPFVRVKIRYK